MSYKTLFVSAVSFLCYLLSNIAAATIQITQFEPTGIPLSAKSAFPYTGIELTDENKQLRYYSSDTSQAVKPLVVILGGSGCEGNFAIQENGEAIQSLEAFLSDFLTDSRVILIDPPNIPRQFSTKESGTSTGCPSEFVAHYDLNYFVSNFELILQNIQSRGWISDKVLLIASSDGTVVATQLLAKNTLFTHALLISGGGASQLFDQMNSALSLESKTEKNTDFKVEIEQVITRWNTILAAKKSDQTFYLGHPYSRWQTFGLASNLDLSKTAAQLYLVQGGQDENVSVSGFALLLSELTRHRKSFLAELIPCGDHFLFCDQEQAPTRLENVIHKAVKWFLWQDVPPDVIVNLAEF